MYLSCKFHKKILTLHCTCNIIYIISISKIMITQDSILCENYWDKLCYSTIHLDQPHWNIHVYHVHCIIYIFVQNFKIYNSHCQQPNTCNTVLYMFLSDGLIQECRHVHLASRVCEYLKQFSIIVRHSTALQPCLLIPRYVSTFLTLANWMNTLKVTGLQHKLSKTTSESAPLDYLIS